MATQAPTAGTSRICSYRHGNQTASRVLRSTHRASHPSILCIYARALGLDRALTITCVYDAGGDVSVA